jgi:hypothetical protein
LLPFTEGPDLFIKEGEMNWRVVSPQWCVFGKRIASMLGVEWSDKAEGAEAEIFIEMFPGMIEEALKYKSTPKICWWTGTDVRVYSANKETYDFGNTFHVTDTPWLIYPLSKKVHPVCFLPLPCSLNSDEAPPYPKDPAILMYLSQHQARDIDRSIEFLEFNQWCPIYVVHGPGVPVSFLPTRPHIINLGNVSDEDRMDLFSKISLYVRFMKFDGLSQLVVEMKSIGRHVASTIMTPFCELIEPDYSQKEISSSIVKLVESPPSPEGREWYRSVFNIETFGRIFEGICNKKGWEAPKGI